MRATIFFVLVVLLGAGLGYALEAVLKIIASGNLLAFFTHAHGPIGVHALSFNISVCGIIGLIISYFVVSKFVKK